MSLTSWLHDLALRQAPTRKRVRRSRHLLAIYRLSLEPLEDRRLLAFSTPVDYAVGSYTTDLKVGDFDGDGIQDLAATVSYSSSGVKVLLGNADGTFQPAQGTFLSSPLSMAVGDFNEDGKLDLATRSDYEIGGNSINVLLGHGDGTFEYAPPPTFWEWSTAIATGDLNSDGHMDLIMTAVSGYFGYHMSAVEVMLGHGDGTFTSDGYVNYFADLTSPALADVNGDGNLDVAAPGLALLGNGDGTLQEPTALDPSVDLWSTKADFNADGHLDLVTLGDSSLGVSLGNGDGSYAPPIWTPLGSSYFNSFSVFDFNDDGRPDVAVTRENNKVSLLLNDGNWSPGDPPTVSVRDATLTEGNTGTANATFTVVLSNSTNVNVTVQFGTADISAAAGSDYTTTSGAVTIPAGQTSATFTVAVKGDRLAETTETFAINLSSPTNATIGDGQGIGTILDNEPRISISDVTKSEGKKGKTTQFVFVVTLSAAYDQSVAMSYQTANGTATTANQDYVAKSGTITFSPGETRKEITVSVKGDSTREANETFYLDLFGLSTNALFSKNRGIGTILNDD